MASTLCETAVSSFREVLVTYKVYLASGRGVTHCGVWRLCSVDLWCVRVLSLRVLRVVSTGFTA